MNWVNSKNYYHGAWIILSSRSIKKAFNSPPNRPFFGNLRRPHPAGLISTLRFAGYANTMNATRSLEGDVLINEVQTGLSRKLFYASFTTSDSSLQSWLQHWSSLALQKFVPQYDGNKLHVILQEWRREKEKLYRLVKMRCVTSKYLLHFLSFVFQLL